MKDNTKGIDNDNSAIDNNVNLLITLLYDDLLFGDIAKLVFFTEPTVADDYLTKPFATEELFLLLNFH